MRTVSLLSLSLFTILSTGAQPGSVQNKTHGKHRASSHTYLLKFYYHPEQTNLYRLDTRISAILPEKNHQPKILLYSMTEDLVEKMQVVKSGRDGSGEIEVGIQSGEGKLNGKIFQIVPPKDPVLFTLASDGTLISASKMGEDNSKMPMLAGLLQSGSLSLYGVVLPKKPLSIGSRWTRSVNLPGDTFRKQGELTARFMGLEQVGPYRTAVIHALLTVPVHIFLDSKSQITRRRQNAASLLSGILKISYGVNLGLSNGKMIRVASSGSIHGTITQLNSAAGKKPTQPIPLLIQLSMGSELIG